MEIIDSSKIAIDAYNYDLPDDRIAKYPLEKRDDSKLLVRKGGSIIDSTFSSLANYIPSGSLLVFNNTRVIQARMMFRKKTGAQIEIFCLEPFTPNDYLLNFQQRARCSWKCLVGNLKKWKDGVLEKKVIVNGCELEIFASKISTDGDSHIIEFLWENKNVSFADILEVCGELPIPPYLNRDTEEADKDTYQTVYSKIDGSVAAPTAGLHFTENVFTSLKDKGIETDEVTLHVGAGTFKPVKSEFIIDHVMHSEFVSVKKSFIEKLINHKGNIIAVGTTSVRTLESLYYLGVSLGNQYSQKMEVDQWMPYQTKNNIISKEKALNNILNYLDKNNLDHLIGNTQIMIVPGYQFKIVNGIITNFHQPQSTLLLLISAFMGSDEWKKTYSHALNNEYRFLSYGDSSLLLND